MAGGQGLLGQTFKTHLSTSGKHVTTIFNKDELDITNLNSLHVTLKKTRPDWLVNCAAFTNVDGAELNSHIAYEVNGTAMSNISKVANDLSIKVMHISTDYVFDGDTTKPYSEDEEPNPINVYGMSKLEGEQILLREMGQGAIILRTAWLYGELKNGFLSQLIDRIRSGEEEIRIVEDQVGQLTLASDVVGGAMQIMDRHGEFNSEIYHLTNQNYGSWKDIGEFTCRVLRGRTKFIGISSNELNRPAQRPAFSALNSDKFANEFFPIRSWTVALEEYLTFNPKAN